MALGFKPQEKKKNTAHNTSFKTFPYLYVVTSRGINDIMDRQVLFRVKSYGNVLKLKTLSETPEEINEDEKIYLVRN